jgi:hypothetical protein
MRLEGAQAVDERRAGPEGWTVGAGRGGGG